MVTITACPAIITPAIMIFSLLFSHTEMITLMMIFHQGIQASEDIILCKTNYCYNRTLRWEQLNIGFQKLFQSSKLLKGQTSPFQSPQTGVIRDTIIIRDPLVSSYKSKFFERYTPRSHCYWYCCRHSLIDIWDNPAFTSSSIFGMNNDIITCGETEM